MNNSFWTKIAVRALGIFFVGILLVAGFRRAVNAKHQIGMWADSLENGSSSVALSLPVSIVPLYVSGTKVGKLDTVVVVRHEPRTIDGLRVVAHLDGGASSHDLEECVFALESVEHFDLQRSITCEDDTTGMVSFGKVVFRGDGVERPLYVGRDDIEDLPWRYHSHGPDWDFDFDEGSVSVDVGDIDIDLGDMNIDIDLGDLEHDLADLADELEDLAIELEGLNIEIDGSRIHIGNLKALEHLDERIGRRLEERLRRLERIKIGSRNP